eukprot:TRINITY_DN15938_c0_g1_i2.p1 TRINITY_DN15938_c0_g1~~TRINITY_DN15938_c0_g1_i2.p1  ORF type:complete len:235 (+),score=30.48 TRINITY_DN15938_c0_g1_i2:86-790(+)
MDTLATLETCILKMVDSRLKDWKETVEKRMLDSVHRFAEIERRISLLDESVAKKGVYILPRSSDDEQANSKDVALLLPRLDNFDKAIQGDKGLSEQITNLERHIQAVEARLTGDGSGLEAQLLKLDDRVQVRLDQLEAQVTAFVSETTQLISQKIGKNDLYFEVMAKNWAGTPTPEVPTRPVQAPGRPRSSPLARREFTPREGTRETAGTYRPRSPVSTSGAWSPISMTMPNNW